MNQAHHGFCRCKVGWGLLQSTYLSGRVQSTLLLEFYVGGCLEVHTHPCLINPARAVLIRCPFFLHLKPDRFDSIRFNDIQHRLP